jgi:hypothetical protein
MMTILDTFWNRINAGCERRDPYRVLLCSASGSGALMQVRQSFGHYDIYQIDDHDISQELPDLLWYDVLIVVGGVDKKLLQGYADAARIADASFYHVGDPMYLEDLISLPQRIGPIMALEYKPSPLDGRWRVVKRVFDMVVSFFALVLLSPLLLLVALAIKLDSKGPVLYMQPRVGKNKLPFTFVKFRSMYTHLST